MSPTLPGWKLIWSDEFSEPAGTLPNESRWNIINRAKKDNLNKEEQQYYIRDPWVSAHNGEALEIKPQKNNGEWYSARIESWRTFACPEGKQMMIQANLRSGWNPYEQQAGIWPAFWTLGQGLRENPKIEWPHCGELDIFESGHGMDWMLGILHYGNVGQDPSSNGVGNGNHKYNRYDFNEFAVKINRVPSDWKNQSISFIHNGAVYHTVYGRDVTGRNESEGVRHVFWQRLAHWPLFIVLNVAVGSSFPGAGQPNDQTASGSGSGLTIKYVAVYESN
ncbi:family 16 glycoside hydrolase [Stachybotrys elegans]|uniref:Family 16 glycoside hydrolase n=1 Tax=Stachybotrys elegans TaxID=80388 RepID=A0A8K0SED6_9HYPO|nr:family 16 glycoside hydrolase [Stachybotrys elegans]